MKASYLLWQYTAAVTAAIPIPRHVPDLIPGISTWDPLVSNNETDGEVANGFSAQAPQPGWWRVANTNIWLWFYDFEDKTDLEDGRGLFSAALGQISQDLQHYGANAIIDHNYWAIDEPPLDFSITLDDPTVYEPPFRRYQLTYIELTSILAAISNYFERGIREMLWDYYTCSFVVTKFLAGMPGQPIQCFQSAHGKISWTQDFQIRGHATNETNKLAVCVPPLEDVFQ